jgi:hypothetical protein
MNFLTLLKKASSQMDRAGSGKKLLKEINSCLLLNFTNIIDIANTAASC